jgi:predicted DNA-binding transcriptional regulator YafY
MDARNTPYKRIQKMLDEEDSIWLSEKKTEVVLTISPAAAVYFKRRALIARQTIIKKFENGGLLVSGKFAHPNQILPIVRYWIPHARIIEPKSWRDEVEAGLRAYLADAD